MPIGDGLVLMAGYRYAGFNEELDIKQASTILGGGASGFAGSSITAPGGVFIRDFFKARDQFYGGQVGLTSRFAFGDLAFEPVIKVAVGTTEQLLDISGSTTRLPDGATVPGGVLALPTNSGRHVGHEISVIPEFELKFHYQLGPGLSVFAGYDFLYWSNVVRPAEQINPSINPTQQPTSLTFGTPNNGPPQPTMVIHAGDLFVNGFTFGVEVRY